MDKQTENNNVAAPPQRVTKPRKGGLLKKFIYAVLILVIILVLGLGYLGFVPGVSKIFGSDKPRDLGVVISPADEQSIAEKIAIQYVVLSSNTVSSLSLSGSKAVDTTFTNEELTALMQKHDKLWKYYPISNAQVRFNADGTAELSGILRTDRIYGYAASTGIATDDVKRWLSVVNAVVSDPPIYLKGKVEVSNGVMSGELQKLEIGRLPVPVSIFVNDQSAILSFAQNRLDNAGVKVESASFASGKANFKGTIPSSVGFAGE